MPGPPAAVTDELATVDQLAALLTRYPYTGRIDHDEAELREVRQTRARCGGCGPSTATTPSPPSTGCCGTRTRCRISTRHDALDWHLHATSPDAPLAERIRAEAALALIDVIRMNEMRPAAGLRGRRLHRPAARPLPQRLQAVLQRALRQPDEHDRLPRAALGGDPAVVNSVAGDHRRRLLSVRTSRCAGDGYFRS